MKTKLICSLLSGLFVLTVIPFVYSADVPNNPIWPRPSILPIPVAVDGVSQPAISLNGTWKIISGGPDNFWDNNIDLIDWIDIKVPAQVDKHLRLSRGSRRGGGFGLQGRGAQTTQSTPDFVYKTMINIPSDFINKRIVLRFAGVTGTSQLWVNGDEIGSHHGGFTPWNYDITENVTPGQDAWITVAVNEPRQSTNTYRGGIIRNVTLMAVPNDYFFRFNIETDLDKDYKNATLKVWIGMNFTSNEQNAQVNLSLKDVEGKSVPMNPTTIQLSREIPEVITDILVANPLKWDAEHPNLYTLEAKLVINGTSIETINKNIGFREVEIDNKKLLVNGKEVKLRGSGQFDCDPLDGHALPDERAVADVLLYKQTSHNFIRPACYPATEAFLDACDRIGMYVECEMPVTFADTAANNEELMPIFLSQCAEDIEINRSHPCVIMWDLANETDYGINIRKMSEYIHNEDTSRPLVFSWSHTVTPSDPLPYEIFSYHYPTVEDDLGTPGVAVFNDGGKLNREIPPMPVLADEYAHPASYNNEEMRRDPGVRNFWGESVKRFWESMFLTEGSLGGAIWAGIDYDSAGFFPWGLFDVWRREKPEAWLTKKAYSPVRLENKPLTNPGAGNPLLLPIKNWFDHSNLKEVTIIWTVGKESGTLQGPNVEPHNNGMLQLPARQWKKDEVVNIKFHTKDGIMVDEYNLPVEPSEMTFPTPRGPSPKIKQDQNQIIITGEDFKLIFSKKTGLITSGSYKGKNLIESGPYLNLLGIKLGDWIFEQIEARTEENEAVVDITGKYSASPEATGGGRGGQGQQPSYTASESVTIEVSFEVSVDGHGLITTKYTLEQFPVTTPEKRVVPWNSTNAGGFEEVGISYILTDEIDKLSWKRKGLWSAYPEDHIGRNIGIASRTGPGVNLESGLKPNWSWAMDEKNFNLFGSNDKGGRGTNDFRSMKENIYFAAAIASEPNIGIRAESNSSDAVRLEVINSQTQENVRLIINNQWNYRNLGLGNYMKEPIIVEKGYSNIIKMRFIESISN